MKEFVQLLLSTRVNRSLKFPSAAGLVRCCLLNRRNFVFSQPSGLCNEIFCYVTKSCDYRHANQLSHSDQSSIVSRKLFVSFHFCELHHRLFQPYLKEMIKPIECSLLCFAQCWQFHRLEFWCKALHEIARIAVWLKFISSSLGFASLRFATNKNDKIINKSDLNILIHTSL